MDRPTIVDLLEASQRLSADATALVAAAGQLYAQAGALLHDQHNALCELVPLECPKCGGPMDLKTSHRFNSTFWGCRRWKVTECKGSINYDKWLKQCYETLAKRAAVMASTTTYPMELSGRLVTVRRDGATNHWLWMSSFGWHDCVADEDTAINTRYPKDATS